MVFVVSAGRSSVRLSVNIDTLKRHEAVLRKKGLISDEIIRQVSISCAERGKLLLAVCDELNLTFGAYESLFCSAIAHGIRRQLKLQQDIEDWEFKIHQIKEKIAEISATHDEFMPTYNLFISKFNTQMESDEKDYSTEYERLLKNNKQLKVSPFCY